MAENNDINHTKQQETEATKKAAVDAAKMYGGGLGKGIELASKTKLGNAYLNKSAEVLNKKNPGIHKGNEDLLNKSKKNSSVNNATSLENATNTSSLTNSNKENVLNSLGNSDKNNQEIEAEGNGDFSASVFRLLKQHWPKVAAVSAGATLFLIIIIAVYILVASISGGVIEFFDKVGDAIVGFFSENEQTLIKKYYEELQDVQSDFQTRYNVCIDVNLITATLTVDLDASEYAQSIEDSPDEKGDKSTGEDEGMESQVALIEKDYKKMTKEVGLLASMQVKNKMYGQDKDIISGEKDCRSIDEGSLEELVTEENLERLAFPNWWDNFLKNLTLSEEKKIEKYVSTNSDLVSRHDLNNFQKFFTKKINEEKNYEYYIYTPAYEEECDSEGKNCELVCHKDAVPSTESMPTLSIGDLKTMKDSVYYWNLVNSFIPNYYDRYLPKEEGEERDKAIKKIAEMIYLLYEDLGPSTNCMTPQEFICRSDEGSDYYSGETSTNGTPIAANQSDFFNKISSVAISEMSRSGIMASVTMAQAALESNWGKSGLSSRYSNYYGISAGSCITLDPNEHKGEVLRPGDTGNSCTGNAYWDGTAVSLCSSRSCKWRRVYDSFDNSTKDHSRLLVSSTYSGCNSYKTAQEQIQCIKSHGYAEDEGYVSKVMSLINKYGLAQYDIGQWDGSMATEPTKPLYNENNCIHMGNDSVVIGDWRNWKQCNQPWGTQKIQYQSICKVGCAATSVAILLAKSGTYTTLGSSLNPGTFVQAHRTHGGFYGDNINWNVTDVAPNFRLVGRYFGGISVAQVANYVNSGEYVILNVKHGGHFVAVDYVSNGTIHIVDPGYNRTVIPGDYTLSEIAGYVVYRKVD